MPSHKERIGAKIRYERMSRNMSIDELAEMLHLSTAFIGLIERGQRGAKLSNLIKIADIFGLTVNDLIYDLDNGKGGVFEPGVNTALEVRRDTIASILFDLNEAEMDFVIATIRNLKEMRRTLNPESFHHNDAYAEYDMDDEDTDDENDEADKEDADNKKD